MTRETRIEEAAIRAASPLAGFQWTSRFEDGHAGLRDRLGGKGAGLAEMSRLGLPVPPGFTITTDACRQYLARGHQVPPGLLEETRARVRELEAKLGKRFGDPAVPLLVSVRSGAKFSMPGMMDTVLNLGMTDAVAAGLAQRSGNPRFARDAQRRFLQMFGDVVLGVPHERFEEVLGAARARRGTKTDTELTGEDLTAVVAGYRAVLAAAGKEAPEDPWAQLELAIRAVFESWANPRAVTYRNIHRIPHDLGTAVNVQAMVFGNMGSRSGSGVAFTRNPATGERKVYGEYLLNAQGEDVVAGTRTPKPLEALRDELPEAHAALLRLAEQLERHYRDVQDVEFTIEEGTFWLLQTRAGKRTAQAAVKIAVDMVKEGILTQEEALLRVEPDGLEQILHPRLDPAAPKAVLAKGLAASPGAARGAAVFDSDTAARRAAEGQAVILVRPETSPDDIHGLNAAQAVVTSRGGMTSHAAIVARGMGKPAVVGAEGLLIDLAARRAQGNNRTIAEGDCITVDGGLGEVLLGEVPLLPAALTGEVQELLAWADKARRLGVRANADTPADARKARELGAEGIGLTRTEHMFFAPDRIPVMREMILAETEAARRAALAKLLPVQAADFQGLLEAMEGYPVIIRLLDPPLHEFLPSLEELLVEVTTLRLSGGDPARLAAQEALLARVKALHEVNPMLGLRGCRLGILYPEIYEMQVRAILRAAIACVRAGRDVHPEVMTVLVGHRNELTVVQEQLERVAQEELAGAGVTVHYKFGTMIELPRAALVADQIAEKAEFFSFGTNDLTQTAFGFSRDDAEAKFLGAYLDKGILPENPFRTLDRDGVGELIRIGTEKGRATRPGLEVGICGEHGGDPPSVALCHELALDYVSCSPHRVPIARLAAAQAALRERMAQRPERDV
jgi:pyruvate,orthophosphate dikinase